jgi:hypothetical protein
MSVKPRFPECVDCRFFNRVRVSGRCLPCGSGEFFEERIRDRDPTADELMRIYARMSNDQDD